MKTGRLYVSLIAGAVLTGLLGWCVVNAVHPIVPMEEELALVVQPTLEQLNQKISHNRWNDSYTLAIFAGLMLISGTPLLLMGSKSTVTSGLAIVLAVVIGVPLGVGSAWLGFMCDDWLPIGMDVLVRVAVRWIAVLGPLGLLAGALVWLTHREISLGKLVIGGGVGAVMAALAYCLLAAFLLQTENTDSAVPASSSGRLLLFMVTPFVVWGFVAYQLASESKHQLAVVNDGAAERQVA